MNVGKKSVQIAVVFITGHTLSTALMAEEQARPAESPVARRYGHSAHGPAFDEGPRQRPWRMEGIGHTHFPITTSVPEVQEWFDQGHTLLHSYWFHEAERAFRWCLKLDPECAMAYWGLYRCSLDGPRGGLFLREASRRKGNVSERERRYIEAWEARTTAQVPVLYNPKQIEDQARFRRLLEAIVICYPDDVEAKALYAMENLFSYTLGPDSAANRYGNELILREVLALRPDHPGAHHYRIHTWDGPDAVMALDSFVAYPRVAPNVGHARHMPGHGYAGLGMWHEAAIAMDAATRVEKKYMQQHLGLPFHEWNYAHNLNYLSYFREQLGMAQAAPRGARELLAAPLDSKFNNPNNLVDSTFREGLAALVRALVKFERWEEILDPGTIPWPGTLEDRIWKSYCEALALHGLERYDEAADRLAELKSLQAEAGKREKEPGERHDEFQILEIEGLLALARGDGHDAVQHLTRAAERELDIRKKFNDPPYHPRILYNVLGESYLRLKAAALAVASFERALDAVPNDGIALAGLIQAHAALGETQKAQELYGRLLHVWSGADSRIRWLAAARALGLAAQPKDHSPAPQRDYLSVKLDDLGPPAWEPFDAPTLDALDSARKTVTLEEYRGRNVVLIFYLGEQCVHCVEQLVAIKDRINDFSLNRTEVLAISSATPEKNAGSQRLGDLGIRLLSDLDHANARRFKSFDDFEDLELHSTILIDGRGRLHWARFGGEPFMDLDFLVAEIRRVNDREGFASAAPAGRE